MTADLRAALDAALGRLPADAVSYVHGFSTAGEATDPVLLVEYESLRAALASTLEPAPVAEGLDVERLARAVEAGLPCEDPEEPCDADGRDDHRWCDYCIARAVAGTHIANLARAYAAASPSPETALRPWDHAYETDGTDDARASHAAGPAATRTPRSSTRSTTHPRARSRSERAAGPARRSRLAGAPLDRTHLRGGTYAP